jgi:hypothetical protein
MNSKHLTLAERLEWAEPPEQAGLGAADEILTDVLQECIFRCDNLANALEEIGVTNQLFDVLGECVVACGQFMAAMSRGSYLEAQYALICAEVCATVAGLCAKLPCDTSLKCASMCQVCAAKIRGLYRHLLLN